MRQHQSARQIIKDRIASRRLIRYYLNIDSIILIQTRIRIILAKNKLKSLKFTFQNAAAIIIQNKFRAYSKITHLQQKSAKIIQHLFIKKYLNISQNSPFTVNLLNNFHQISHDQINIRTLHQKSLIITNFFKMACKRHKFKLHLLSQQISARIIQKYYTKWLRSRHTYNIGPIIIHPRTRLTSPPGVPQSTQNLTPQNNLTINTNHSIINNLSLIHI